MRHAILIVDDEPINVGILEETIQGQGAIMTASTAEQAFELLKSVVPDVILLGPGPDAYETCRRLRRDPNLTLTKIILVSGKTRLRERLQEHEADADDSITKPFLPDELLTKVKVYLRLVDAERELANAKEDLQEKARLSTGQIAPLPTNESERLKALRAYQILDTGPEQQFEDLVFIASLICQVPIAAISLVDQDRQWFKSSLGLGVQETHRDFSFCAHAINDAAPMVVEDAWLDERFSGNPLVMGAPGIRFYAGIPLIDQENHVLGTLCVIDREPRRLDAHQISCLQAMGRQVMSLLDAKKRLNSVIEIQRARLVKDISSGLAHEINNPLAIAIGNLNLLRATIDKELEPRRSAQQESLNPYIEKCAKGLARVKNVVSCLGQVAERPASGTARREKVIGWVLGAVQLFETRFEQAGIEVTILEQTKALETEGFRQELLFMIHHLLQNSLEAISGLAEKWIQIEIESIGAGEQIQLSITDSGTDLGPTARKKLFQPFFTTKGVGQNQGLGLYVAKRIAEAHQGILEYDHKSRNTRFVIRLPVRLHHVDVADVA